MKKLLAVVTLVASLGLLATAADVTLRGKVGDSMCGAKHTGADAKDAKCAQACVKEHGADPVFVSDGKVYKIADDSKAKVMDHVGHKVTIDGTMNGDTITVNDVKM